MAVDDAYTLLRQLQHTGSRRRLMELLRKRKRHGAKNSSGHALISILDARLLEEPAMRDLPRITADGQFYRRLEPDTPLLDTVRLRNLQDNRMLHTEDGKARELEPYQFGPAPHES
jgi:hypothetical protein